MNNVAQIIETIHEVEEVIDIIGRILQIGIQEEDIVVPVKAGRWIGAVEAPHGLLIHNYTYDDNSSIIKANCIIPTNQNHANIQYDLKAFISRSLDKSEDGLGSFVR